MFTFAEMKMNAVRSCMEEVPRHSHHGRGTKGSVEQKGACNKAPGRDGICLELFKVKWDNIKDDMLAIFNQMYLNGRIMEQQKQCIVVYILKTYIPNKPADYRPITLLDTNCKILAHIVANPVKSTFPDMLHPSQYYGVSGYTIFGAVATVREAIVYAKLTHAPLCTLSSTSQQLFTGSRILVYFGC